MSTSTTNAKYAPSHVHIVGAGLGGLTLARILQLRSVPVTIYERETSADARSQGGTLNLHVPSGQRALKLAGLHDKFEENCSRLRENMIIRYKDGTIAYQDEEHDGPPPGLEGPPPGEHDEEEEDGHGPPDDRPEIDRGVLRQILLDSLQPNTIQWGHTLREIKRSPSDSKTHLIFERQDASKLEVDAEFVVGADGAWSRTRTTLTSAMPLYSGVSFVETELLDASVRHPAFLDLVGPGSMLGLADNKALVVQQNSNDRMKVYLFLRVPEEWMAECGIPFATDVDATRSRLLGMFDGWSEDMRDVIRYSEPKFIPRPVVCMDTEARWQTRPGITLIGDAAHVMSPFAGEGANLAMLDAAELECALIGERKEKYGNLDEALAGFEKKMMGRAEDAGKESEDNMNLFISEEGARLASEKMHSMMAGGPPPPGEKQEH